MSDTGKPYDFRSRSLTRSQPLKGGRGRGKFGLNESMSTYETEMEIEVGSNTIARNSSFDKFEGIEVHAEEKQRHTGDSITSKGLEYDNRRSQTPTDLEISDHDNYAKNRNLPGTSDSVVSTEKRSYTDLEEMYAELRRELVNTKKELAESRVRHEAKDVKLGRKDEAFNQMHEEINEIRTNFQTRLENTEQELNRTQQDLSFAQSQIANNQVVDNRQMETSSNREISIIAIKKIGISKILDDALDFACKLSPDVQNNISQLRDALQRRYGDNRLPEQYREDLANIKKHFKETLPEYAARGLPDQSIAYEVKIRKPQSIDDAIEWFNWHECCKGNIFKKRAEVRQIETEEQYDHTEFIEENEIRRVGNTRFVAEERDIDIGKSKLSVAFEDNDKFYAVDNICGDEPDRSKLSVASSQFDDADINVSESSFLDEYVTVDPSVDISSVDVVIDRIRAVTLRVPIVIEGDYLNAVIDTGAEVTVMSQEKFLKIPENRRPQIYKAERT
ncbi:GCC2 [Mytilus edulis]|uniref:GCC2 n=1 Tax=Mytilus edulis TaxID=6550 RepID=A0A8S3SI69_MYTED|nr:GCC2 [Mytilus edulis]